jgi:hypothetical protein
LIVAAVLREAKGLGPLRLAILATLGFVLELLVVKEELFAGGEDEVGIAINTL